MTRHLTIVDAQKVVCLPVRVRPSNMSEQSAGSLSAFPLPVGGAVRSDLSLMVQEHPGLQGAA